MEINEDKFRAEIGISTAETTNFQSSQDMNTVACIDGSINDENGKHCFNVQNKGFDVKSEVYKENSCVLEENIRKTDFCRDKYAFDDDIIDLDVLYPETENTGICQENPAENEVPEKTSDAAVIIGVVVFAAIVVIGLYLYASMKKKRAAKTIVDKAQVAKNSSQALYDVTVNKGVTVFPYIHRPIHSQFAAAGYSSIQPASQFSRIGGVF